VVGVLRFVNITRGSGLQNQRDARLFSDAPNDFRNSESIREYSGGRAIIAINGWNVSTSRRDPTR